MADAMGMPPPDPPAAPPPAAAAGGGVAEASHVPPCYVPLHSTWFLFRSQYIHDTLMLDTYIGKQINPLVWALQCSGLKTIALSILYPIMIDVKNSVATRFGGHNVALHTVIPYTVVGLDLGEMQCLEVFR